MSDLAGPFRILPEFGVRNQSVELQDFLFFTFWIKDDLGTVLVSRGSVAVLPSIQGKTCLLLLLDKVDPKLKTNRPPPHREQA